MKKVSGILLPALLLAVLVSSITAVSLHAKYLTVSDVKYFNLKVTADYFMHFDANGGTLTSPTEDDDTWSGVSETTATKVVEVGQPCGELPAAERTGYTFAGWGPDSRLPDGFQEVEFLESSGNEYVDTEYKPYQATFGFDIDLIFYNDLSGIRTVMSVYDTWDSSSACFGLGGNYQAYCSQCIGWTGAASQIGTCLTPGERGRITTVNNGDYDGATGKSTYTVTSPLITKTYQATGNKTVKNPLPVFSGRSGSGIAEKSHTRIYSLKLLECNTPVRDFVPAVWQGGETTYSKNGVTVTGTLAEDTPGLYDLVGKVFYVNSGSVDDFKFGDPVSNGAVVDGDTPVAIPGNHTLYAAWEEAALTMLMVPGEEIPEEEAAEETPAEEQPAPEEEAKEEPAEETPEEMPEEELPAEETSGEEIPAEEGEEAIAEEPEEKTLEEPAEAIPEERSDEPEAPPEKTEVPESASPVSEAEETSAE